MDHHAVLLRLAVDTPMMRRGKGPWMMKPTLIEEGRIKVKIHHKWAAWKTNKRYYQDAILWESYVKKQLRYFMRQEEAVLCKDHRLMEDHLYESIYDILRSSTPRRKTTCFNKLQSKNSTQIFSSNELRDA